MDTSATSINRRGFLQTARGKLTAVAFVAGTAYVGRDGHRESENPHEGITFNFMNALAKESQRSVNRSALSNQPQADFLKRDLRALEKDLFSAYQKHLGISFHKNITASPVTHKIIEALQRHGISADQFRFLLDESGNREIVLVELLGYAHHEERYFNTSLGRNFQEEAKQASFIQRFIKNYSLFAKNPNYN